MFCLDIQVKTFFNHKIALSNMNQNNKIYDEFEGDLDDIFNYCNILEIIF